MDEQEWQAHEDEHDLKEAQARLERYQLAGAKKGNGQPFALHDLLPPHLAKEYAPKQQTEAEIWEKLIQVFPVEKK